MLIESPLNKGKKGYCGKKSIAIRSGKVIKADLCRPKEKNRKGRSVGLRAFLSFSSHISVPHKPLVFLFLSYGIFIDFCEIISWQQYVKMESGRIFIKHLNILT